MKPINLLALFVLSTTAWAGFGVKTGEKHYTLDTGAGLVFSVLQSSGSITSIKLHDTELHGPKSSGIASGLGPEGTKTMLSANDQQIVITVATDAANEVAQNLTHYYLVRKGENTIYMATHAEKEPNVGELRWITRLKSAPFPSAPKGSDLRGTTGAIESSDVFGFADKTSRSKYYGNERAMELGIRGVTGKGIGVFMVYGSRESSSGGPFFRDIQNQTGENNAEVYNYMNSGHNQTEPNRLGVLHGPYALVFTDGSTPAAPDMSFIAQLGLKGYVSADKRGSVKIEALHGCDAKHDYLIGLSNNDAQYWAKADEPCSGVKPGKYTLQIYKGELMVHTAAVTIKAGETTIVPTITITRDPAQTKALWHIGDWDGTPLEFRNGGNISMMHPSDVRQATWVTGDFTIGTSTLADFPACQWMRINGTQTVKFTLTREQLRNYSVRIGLSASFAGARPRLAMNSWTSKLQKNSAQPDSRSITIGTYRGNNATHSFSVPASAFVEGVNTLKISVVSGRTAEGFLSPGYAIDCIDLCPQK